MPYPHDGGSDRKRRRYAKTESQHGQSVEEWPNAPQLAAAYCRSYGILQKLGLSDLRAGCGGDGERGTDAIRRPEIDRGETGGAPVIHPKASSLRL